MTTATELTELATPFDDLDSPETVATPSCCCCCCCCLATVATTMTMAGYVVRDDIDDLDNDIPAERRHLLISLAAALPLLAVIGTIVLGSALAGTAEGDGLAAVAFAVAVAGSAFSFAAIRIRAGRPAPDAILRTVGALLVVGVALLIELVAVLLTVGLFWLTIPFWLALARRSRRRTDES